MPLWSSMLSQLTHEATMIFFQSARFSMSSLSSRPSQYRYMPGSRRALSLYISQRKPSRLSPGRGDSHGERVPQDLLALDPGVPDLRVGVGVKLVEYQEVEVPRLQRVRRVRQNHDFGVGLLVRDNVLADVPLLAPRRVELDHRAYLLVDVANLVLGGCHHAVLAVVDRLHRGHGEQDSGAHLRLAVAGGQADDGAAVLALEAPVGHLARGEERFPDVLALELLQIEGRA